MSSESKSLTYPVILDQLLELVQHQDDKLSGEASLVLRFYFERFCLKGDASWISEVEAFLDFQDHLACATGTLSIRKLGISPQELNNLANTVFSLIEYGVTRAWRHAYILKQATCVPGLQDRAAVYLHDQWRVDEAVSLHLLNLIWETVKSSNFENTLLDISVNAESETLRESAVQRLRVMEELQEYQSKSADR